jgi:hypothetical protein
VCQAVSHRSVTPEARFQSQDLPNKVSGGQSGVRIGFLLVSIIRPTVSLCIHSSITDAALS